MRISEIRLGNNYLMMIDGSKNKDSDRINKVSYNRYFIAITVILVIAVYLVQVYLPMVLDILPQKDPYHLVMLDTRHQELYGNQTLSESSPEIQYELAQLAFLKGEIHEADYFLEQAQSGGVDVGSLRSNILKYKNLKRQLETSLYENRKFYQSPFLYTDEYDILNQILNLSDTGYIHVRHLFLKGYLLLREGRRTEARRIFNDLKTNGGVLSETSLYFYARTYIQDQDIERGIDAFEKYIENNPETRLTPLAYYYQSTLYHADGDFKKSVETAHRGLELQLDTEYIPDLYLAKEMSLREIDIKKADQTLIEIFKDYPDNKFVFARAIQKFEQMSEQPIPQEKNALYLEIANVLIENGRYIQSKQLLDKLKTDNCNIQKAYSIYLEAKRLKGLKEYSTAISRCQGALENHTDRDLLSRIYLLIGELYGLQKIVTSAERYYKLSGDSQGEVGDYALRQIARIAYRNGWRVKAEVYYRDLVDNFPESRYVSEALNYLVVLAFYKNDRSTCERYAKMLSEKGTGYEDRLKGEYFLYRLGKGSKSYATDYPLCYYSFIVEEHPVRMYLNPKDAYPSVNKYKDNLAWEYILASCYDLAEKEFEYQNEHFNNPYSKMALCYLGYFHRQYFNGIIKTRDFSAGNYQAEIEKGYMNWFMEKAFPVLYHSEIESYAPEYDISMNFVLGIIRQESFFNTDAVSSAGALGLMQIMPATGTWIAERLGERRQFTTAKLKEPNTNIRYGTWYLDHLRFLHGDEPGMILAGHNAGPGNLSRWKEMYPIWQSDKYLFYELIPIMETRNFVRNVQVNQFIYKKLLEEDGIKVYF